MVTLARPSVVLGGARRPCMVSDPGSRLIHDSSNPISSYQIFFFLFFLFFSSGSRPGLEPFIMRSLAKQYTHIKAFYLLEIWSKIESCWWSLVTFELTCRRLAFHSGRRAMSSFFCDDPDKDQWSKGTEDSFSIMDPSVTLTPHHPSDLGSLVLIQTTPNIDKRSLLCKPESHTSSVSQ